MKESTLHKIMSQAWKSSEHSECKRKKVGAVLVDRLTYKIVSSGYGGATIECYTCIRDLEEWKQDGCWSVHAELRALLGLCEKLNIPPSGLGSMDLIMFTTHGPCDQCLKYMDLFGIRTCVYDIPYHNNWEKWTGRVQVFSLKEAYELL